MIRLKFQAFQDAHSVTIGPAEGYRAAGNFLRQIPGNVVVAEYSRHQWHVRDGHFSAYLCTDRCRIYFADVEGARSETFGPFGKLHVADGTMYADGELFAKFIDESLLWHSFELETFWPNLIISAVD